MTRVPLTQLTEFWAAQQREQQERILSLFIEGMTAFGLSDEEQLPLIAAMRAELADRFEREMAEIVTLVARGMRTEGETLH